MKSIGFREFSLLTVILTIFAGSTRGNPLQTLRNSEIDSTLQFVSFSIDDANTNASRNVKLHFYYLDSLAHGQLVSIASTDTKLIINAPTLLFEANEKQTPFLIYPGEKINIKYAGSDSTQMYIKGNIKRTNELNLFRQMVKKTGNIYYFLPTMPYQKKVTSLADIQKLEKTINDLKNSRLQFLSSFAKQFVISDFENKTAFKCIESTALLDSVFLYYNNRVLLANQNEYVKLITEKIATVKNIGFVPYPMYYVACVDLVSIATGISPYGSISNNRIEFAKRSDFIKESFEGETKDFLLANALNWALTNKVSISKKDIDEFNNQCITKGYQEIIAKKFNENKASYPKGGNTLLSGDGKTVQDLSTVISKYKEKIVLLDFWASWCSPCREEMPYTNKLKKEYEGKNIVFVAISIDSDISAWQKANREESLEKTNSFLLLNADRATFVKQYRINSIPRYLLLGKDGKIISDDAPRPSAPKLKSIIDKYLASNLQ